MPSPRPPLLVLSHDAFSVTKLVLVNVAVVALPAHLERASATPTAHSASRVRPRAGRRARGEARRANRPRSHPEAHQRHEKNLVFFDIRPPDDLKSSARDAADGKSVRRRPAAPPPLRSSETAYDDSVGTSSDSLLGMAVRRVVLDLDGSAGDQADGPADADSRRVRTKPEPRRTPPSKKKLGTRERIASLPPDLAQVVFDAVVATKRLGAGGVPLARQFKYLWFVDLAACGDVAEDDVVETLLSTNARTLLRLSVARCRRLTEASLRGLERRHAFPALTHLDLSECAMVTDETLACVARAPNLETLKAEGCAVVGGGLRHVSKLEKLKHLSLERCGRLCGAMLGVVGELGPVPEKVGAPSVAHATNVSTSRTRLSTPRRSEGRTREGGAGADEDALCRRRSRARGARDARDAEPGVVQPCLGRRHRDTRRLEGTEEGVLCQDARGAAAAAAIRRLPNLVAPTLTGTPSDDDAPAVLTGFSPVSKPASAARAVKRLHPHPRRSPRAPRALLEATRVTGRAGVLVAGAFASSLVGLNAAFTGDERRRRAIDARHERAAPRVPGLVSRG